MLGNGNFVLLGEIKENTHYNAILQCVNPDGNLLWRKVFPNISSESILGSSIKYSSSDDAIYLLVNSDAMSNSYKTEDAIDGTMDYWFAKINQADGSILWDKTIGTNGDDYYYSYDGDPACFVETESYLYVAMTTNGGISGTRTCERKGRADMLVTKLDKSGNIILDKSIGNDMYTLTRYITELPDNRLAFGSVSDGNIAFDKTEPCKGGNDLWFIITDDDINVLADKTIGTSYGDWGTEMNMCYNHSNNSIVVATTTPTNDIDNDNIWYGGASDIWLFEITAQTNYIESKNEAKVSAYPNPATESISIVGDNIASIQICNLLGGVVYETQQCNENNVISTDGMGAGSYFVRVRMENGKIVTKKIIVM
jgi:hypothetical protein